MASPRRRRPWFGSQDLPGDLIQDELDFRATHAFVVALRDASTSDHPGAWQERRLESSAALVQPTHNFKSLEEYLDENKILSDFESLQISPPTPRNAAALDPESGLPFPTINMAKAIFFRFSCLNAAEFRLVAPPHLARFNDDSPEFIAYGRTLRHFMGRMEKGIVHRAREIVSSIVLTNIQSDEFKRRCRAAFSHLTLETFFFKAVTEDQLYWIYRPIWAAIDFSVIQGSSDTLPDNPTQLDKAKFDVRKFTKLGFASFASLFFEYCLQRKGLRHRQDSMLFSRAEGRFFASIADAEVQGEAETLPDAAAEEERKRIAKEEIDRYNEGLDKVILFWRKEGPSTRFFGKAGHLPVTSNFNGNNGSSTTW